MTKQQPWWTHPTEDRKQPPSVSFEPTTGRTPIDIFGMVDGMVLIFGFVSSFGHHSHGGMLVPELRLTPKIERAEIVSKLTVTTLTVKITNLPTSDLS
jgi:hypothetical protein